MKLTYKHYRYIDRAGGVSDCQSAMMFGYADTFQGRHGVAIRYYKGISSWKPTEKGGYTVCTDQDSGKTGVAECSPRDNFCYRIGRDIARGRVFKAMSVDRIDDNDRLDILGYLCGYISETITTITKNIQAKS